MPQQTTTVEFWVLVDSTGDYAVGKDADLAKEGYENDIQPVADAEGFRLVKVALTMPLPQVIEMTGTVPADGEATLAVA